MINDVFCLEENLGFLDRQQCLPEGREVLTGEAFVLNDFYSVYLEHKKIMVMNYDDMAAQCKLVANREDENFWIDLIIHLPLFPVKTTYSLMLGGMLKGCEIMLNFKLKAGKLRQLSVYLSIKKKKLEGDSIRAFLETESERDILSGYPFVYDTHSNTLEFPLPVSNKYVRNFGMKM